MKKKTARKLKGSDVKSKKNSGLLSSADSENRYRASKPMKLTDDPRFAQAVQNYVVEFQGHWGFQYYMQLFGARPLETGGYGSQPGDLIVIPKNNVNIFPISLQTTEEDCIDVDLHSWATTMSKEVGAGFYFSGWGPLPFALGPVPPERYYLLKVAGP